MNRLTTIIGFSLGSLLAIALLVNAAVLFRPLHADPQLVGTVALEVAIPYGKTGLQITKNKKQNTNNDAADETCLSSAYSVAQFFGWEWGRYKRPHEAPRFTLAWLTAFALALLLVLTGVPPLQLVEWAIVFSILVLPLTYLPLL